MRRALLGWSDSETLPAGPRRKAAFREDVVER